MIAAQAHRGPDGLGLWLDANRGFGFCRLAIQDLSASGNQPLFNENGQVVCVCNGEIYNWRSLRNELEGRGHLFSSSSDSEVCVHAYEEYGLDFVHQLRGMFAIAIYDLRCDRLLLVRDRMGIKPLHLRRDPDGLRFASELAPLNRCGDRIDRLGLNLFFARDSLPAPHTIFTEVTSLCPGEWALLEKGKFRRHHYWRPHFLADRGRSEGSFQEELRCLLEESVREHLQSDVPVGFFLSGGVDSTAVLGFARKRMISPPLTFTLGFQGEAEDEARQAQATARLWNTIHRETAIARHGIEALMDEAFASMDQPFADSSYLPTFQVSRLARQGVKVVLSGDGADELFGGYLSQSGARRLGLAAACPEPLRRALARLLGRLMSPSASLEKLKLPNWLLWASLRDNLFRAQELDVLRLPWRVERDEVFALYEPLRAEMQSLEPLNAYFAGLWNHYLADGILTKIDRASSAHGLEVRVPILDHRIVELAARIPPELKYRNGQAKNIFSQAVAEIVGRDVLRRPKLGFGLPNAYYFDDVVSKGLSEVSRHPAVTEILNLDGVTDWPARLRWRTLVMGAWLARRGGS